MKDLTARQLEVLELLAKGLTNREIGSVLEIATGTVKHHVEAILEALEVANRTEATTAYHELRGSDPPLAVGADPDAASRGIPGFRGRPALAVLPFDAVGGDPDDELRAEGITEGLIAALASWRWFPVIASSSSAVYRGHPRDLARIGRELDVRYLVEGDVRRSGDTARIRTRLIDATSGQQIWSHRRDGEVSRAFALEDEVAAGVASALEPALARVEWRRSEDRGAGGDSYELVRRGHQLSALRSEHEMKAAQTLYQAAVEADPGSARALTALAGSYLFQVLSLWSDSVGESIEQALQHASRAVEIDPESYLAHEVLAFGLFMNRRREEAIAHFERALDLNPSSALTCWGLGAALQQRDRVDESIALLERAVRLSPHDPLCDQFLVALALSYLLAGRHHDAIDRAQAILRLQPDSPQAYDVLSCAYGYTGQLDRAHAAVKRMLELRPFSLETVRMLNSRDVVDCLVGGWRKVGLPGLD